MSILLTQRVAQSPGSVQGDSMLPPDKASSSNARGTEHAETVKSLFARPGVESELQAAARNMVVNWRIHATVLNPGSPLLSGRKVKQNRVANPGAG